MTPRALTLVTGAWRCHHQEQNKWAGLGWEESHRKTAELAHGALSWGPLATCHIQRQCHILGVIVHVISFYPDVQRATVSP